MRLLPLLSAALPGLLPATGLAQPLVGRIQRAERCGENGRYRRRTPPVHPLGSADLDYDPVPRIQAALDGVSTEDVTIEILPDADHGLFRVRGVAAWDWPRPSPGWSIE